jgi:hypothetical protein
MAIDFNQKKRRHHFVWQHHLRAWRNAAGQVVCRRKDGTTFMAATQNVALATDFYRLKEITQADVDFIEATCIANAPPQIQPTLRGWIPTFTALFKLRDAMRSAGLDVESEKSAELFDIAANNLEEELHASFESDAIPHLDALRQGKLEFLDDDDQFIKFCQYICVQYMRTRKRREAMFAAFSGVDLGPVNLKASWGLMSHVLATNLGFNLFIRRNRMAFTLLRSPDYNLITGDQPVINLGAVGIPNGQEVETFAFYYPIGPSSALLMETDQVERSVTTREISMEDAISYNAAIIDQSDQHAYALAEQDLP